VAQQIAIAVQELASPIVLSAAGDATMMTAGLTAPVMPRALCAGCYSPSEHPESWGVWRHVDTAPQGMSKYP
jgi:hypothetical protein